MRRNQHVIRRVLHAIKQKKNMSSAPSLTVLRFSRVVTSIISGSVVKSTDCTEIITDTESRSGPWRGQGRSPRRNSGADQCSDRDRPFVQERFTF